MPSATTMMPRPSPEFAAILASLVCRVPGALAALLLGGDGALLARSHGEAADLAARADRLRGLLRLTQDAAAQVDHGPVREVFLEAERRSLALMPLRSGCSLVLLLRSAATPGQALFEARRAAATLNRIL